MALSSEDRTEIRLLIAEEFEKLFQESGGFSEARRAVDRRKQELEAELLIHQRTRAEANGVWMTDSES